MDLDDFRCILETFDVDVWSFIDTAIRLAHVDFGSELKQHRDEIVEALYATDQSRKQYRNCDRNCDRNCVGETDVLPEKENIVADENPDQVDRYAGLFDDEWKSILEMKQHLEDPDQPEEAMINILQGLDGMDVTFNTLKETDIGRHVNKLRKHSSVEIRRLVKQLVRKWKEIVDKWVLSNPQGDTSSPAMIADGESPVPKLSSNGYHQIPDADCPPVPPTDKLNHAQNGATVTPVSEKKHSDTPQLKSNSVLRKPASDSQRRADSEIEFDSEKLASARRRLHENYKEAENAKKQRTIQVMDIHQIPKPKNAFFAKNKGAGSNGRQR